VDPPPRFFDNPL
jgi:hypothetical protein